jgi:hypothetical protein
MQFSKPTTTLGKHGAALWRWLCTEFGDPAAVGVGPLASELCQLQDRLLGIRAEIAKSGLVNSRGQKNPLIAEEVRVSGQLLRVWKALGLSDDARPKNPVGRPSSGDAARRGGR